MWIDEMRLQKLCQPRTDAQTVDRLLTNIRSRSTVQDLPEGCLICRKPLVVRTEGPLAVRKCPSNHAAWLTHDDIARLTKRATRARRFAGRRPYAVTLLVIAAGLLSL